MDFNLTLSAFEPNLQWLRFLISLAYENGCRTPIHFIFTSSVACAGRWTEESPVPEEAITNPSIAIDNGYSESKWVSERILHKAVEQGGFKATILRIGQLSGSTQNGAWDTSGWLPLIVKSGERFKTLPALPGQVSWLPIDLAARAVRVTVPWCFRPS
jgi:thioester reductase-like protein